MKGADEYCRLFTKAEQYGRLYLLPHYHARGKTFNIYVLPDGEDVIPNGGMNPPLNKDAVEVYGIVSGQPGWTEEYGWLHKGPWQEDFKMICENRERELMQSQEEFLQATKDKAKSEAARISKLLQTY